MVVKLLFELFEQFEYRFGSDGSKLLLIKVLLFMYRILVTLGIQFYAPFAVSVKDEASANVLIRELHGLIPIAEIGVGGTDAELEKKLRKYNEEALVVTGVEAKTKYEDIKRFVDICRYSGYKGQKFDDPVVVVCVGDIPVSVHDTCIGKVVLGDGNLHLADSKTEGWEAFARCLITEIKKRTSIIEWEIKQMKKSVFKKEDSSTSEGMEVWYAIEVIMRAIIENSTEPKSSKLMEKISNGVCEIEEQWLIDPVEGQFDEMFRSYLFKTEIKFAADLKRVTEEDITRSNETVFFEEENYYISESLFRKISAPLLGVITASDLKAHLADAGILTQYGLANPKYTSHQTMITIDGQVKCPRLMKLRRNKIDRLGRLKLVDVIQSRGGR